MDEILRESHALQTVTKSKANYCNKSIKSRVLLARLSSAWRWALWVLLVESNCSFRLHSEGKKAIRQPDIVSVHTIKNENSLVYIAITPRERIEGKRLLSQTLNANVVWNVSSHWTRTRREDWSGNSKYKFRFIVRIWVKCKQSLKNNWMKTCGGLWALLCCQWTHQFVMK